MKVKKRYGLLTAAISLQAVYGVTAIGIAAVLNYAVDTVASAKNSAQLLQMGLFFAAAVIVFCVSRMAADSMTQIYAERCCEDLRGRIYEAVFSMDCAEFSKRDRGDYMNNMTSDILLVREQYYAVQPMIASFITQFLACVVYSVFLNVWVAAVLACMSAVQYFVPLIFGKKINRLTECQSAKTGQFTSKIKEILFGFSVIKSYGAQRQLQGEFDKANHEMTHSREKTSVMTQVMMCTNMLIAWTMIFLSVLTAGWFVIKGTMTTGSLFAVFYIANRYSMPVMDFAAACTKLKGINGVRKRLEKFVPKQEEIRPKEAVPFKKEIQIRQLNFAYHENEPVLKNISCTFEKGKKYLLLGESGCGKSTLLKLLAGQYPCEGIFIDGKRYPAETGKLAGKLILVEQQPYVFKRSIADNIDFKRIGDRQKLEEAMHLCCLEDMIAMAGQGEKTVIDEEQRALSGGQKARIGLARAIYAEPDILLLDEVTGALDKETARKIEEMILNLKDVLVIHIAHKPSKELYGKYDAVFEMEGGRLLRRGGAES